MKFISDYKKTLKAIEVEELFDLILYRPLAFLFVKLIYNTEITPNQITAISLIFGIIGGVSYGFGTHENYIAGALLYLLYNVLDCSDGQLARLKNNGTPIGRILDGFSDYFAAIALYLGIGFGFASNSDNPLLWWSLTIAAGISNAIHSGLLDFYRNRFLDITLNRKSVLEDELDNFIELYEELKSQKGKYFDKIVILVYIKYSSIQGVFTTDKNSSSTGYDVNKKLFYTRNKKIMHLWTYLGPTTQWTFLIVCSILNRLDIYLVGLVVVGNLLALIFRFTQSRIDTRLNLKGA